MAEVGGAGGGARVGLKENSSQTILLVWGHQMLTMSPYSASSLPPNLITVHPKLTSQTDPVLSLTITSTLRPNESTLYQEQPLTIWSTHDHHPDKSIPSLYQRLSWLLEVEYSTEVSYSVAHHEVIFSIHFPKRENKWLWLKAASFWKLSRNNVPPCNYSG